MSNNKSIAKNTLFLYIRMFIIMGVSLFTSRVVLDKLGVSDYGLYNVVGGVAMMLTFISSTLAIGTSRFITYELGRKDLKKLNDTFVTAFYTHLALGLLFVIIFETVGLWFVHHKLVIPPDRMDASLIVFQISVLSVFISVTQSPYSAMILAHEKMGVYAYVGIFEAIAKLIIVYLLVISPFDKLIIYAALVELVHISVALFYRIYCTRRFIEAKLRLIFDKSIFKSLISFSGWNLLANLSETLKYQGYLVLLNMFFSPIVVAAQAIANQVSGAMLQFVNNFRLAINPQIIKTYAENNYEDSKQLVLNSTVLVFDLFLLMGLPTITIMNILLNIWLVEVPEYAVVFARFVVLQRIIGVFDSSFYIPLMASGKVKGNSIYAVFLGIGSFVLLYFIYRLGGDVMWIQYIGLIVMIAYSFFIKPSLLIKEVNGYKVRDFIPCYITCLKVAALSVALTIGAYCLFGNDELVPSLVLFVFSIISVAFSSYIFMGAVTKNRVKVFIKSKLHKKNNIVDEKKGSSISI